MKNFTNFNDYIEKLKALTNKIADLEQQYKTTKKTAFQSAQKILIFVYRVVAAVIFKTAYAADINQMKFDDYSKALSRYKQNNSTLPPHVRNKIINDVRNLNERFGINCEIIESCKPDVYKYGVLHDKANEILQKEFGIKIIGSGSNNLNASTNKHKYDAKYLLPLDIAKYIFEHKAIAKKYHDIATDIFCNDRHLQQKIILKKFLKMQTKGNNTMNKNTMYKVHNTEKPEDTAIWHNPIKALPKKEREVAERQAKHNKQLSKNDGIPENDLPENEVRPIIRNDDALLEILLKCKQLAPLIETRITSDWDVELFGNINKANKKLLDGYFNNNYQQILARYDECTIPNVEGEVKKDKAKLRPMLLCELQKTCSVLTKQYPDDISQGVLTEFSKRISKHINMTARFLRDYNIDFNACIETKF